MSDKKTIDWSYSFNNERFYTGESSEKLTLAAAKEESSELEAIGEENKFVYIGKARVPDVQEFFPDADLIIEHIQCQAYDIGGEWAEGFPDVDKAAEDELSEALKALLKGWCEKHEVAPSFFEVTDVKKYDIQTLRVVSDE